MIDLNKYPKLYEEKLIPMTAASILVTEDCNLRCKYCFEKHKQNKMSIEVADRTVDFLFQNAGRAGQRSVGMTMFGGEPLMAPDIVERIVRRAWAISKKTGISADIGIITNGTLLPKNIEELLKEAFQIRRPIGIQISSDGPPDVHDYYRVTVGGGPSSHLIERNIPKFKEIYGKDFNNYVSVHGVLNEETIGRLYESYKFFKEEWGFNRSWFIPVCEGEWTETHIKKYFEQMGLITQDILKEVKRTRTIAEVDAYAPLDRSLQTPTGKLRIPCGAGKNYGTITSAGDVYPCHNIYFNDPDGDSLLGNIFTGINENARRIYTQYDETDMSCDGSCDHTFCYRCIAINWGENGNLFSQVRGNYCKLMKIDRYYQDKIRKELISMGLINGEKGSSSSSNGVTKKLTSKEAGFDCQEVYQDYGACYIVDISSSVLNITQDDINEALGMSQNIRETKKEESIFDYNEFSKEVSCDSDCCDCKGCGEEKQEETKEEKSCCDSNCCSNEEFEKTVAEALMLIINKINSLEKKIFDK